MNGRRRARFGSVGDPNPRSAPMTFREAARQYDLVYRLAIAVAFGWALGSMLR